jgi:hypothetical protein
MGGIISYFHGEAGVVKEKVWVIGSRLELKLVLDDNPHRGSALDYGTDIGIDPDINTGDFCRYFRLDETCGIWLKDRNYTVKQIRKAIQRVLKNRKYIDDYKTNYDKKLEDFDINAFAKNISISTKASVTIDLSFITNGYPPDKPTKKQLTKSSLFLSYSSKNILLAHEIYQMLSQNHLFEVWFDIDQPLKPTDPKNEINKWLEKGVQQSKNFVLLWTKEAAKSSWVRSEIQWALKQLKSDPEFKLVILKLHDESIKDELLENSYVIDIKGLWASNGINEELISILYNHPRRTEWNMEHKFYGLNLSIPTFDIRALKESIANFRWFLHVVAATYSNLINGVRKSSFLSYGDFGSKSGVVKNFSIKQFVEQKYWIELKWQLEVIIDGKLETVHGAGPFEPVDLDIKPGDKVGFYFRRKLSNGHVGIGLPLWLCSENSKISFEDVINKYHQACKIKYEKFKSTGKCRISLIGKDIYERLLTDMLVINTSGETIKMDDLFKLGVGMKDIFEKVSLPEEDIFK